MMDLDGEDANLEGNSDLEGDLDGDGSSQGVAEKKEEKKDGESAAVESTYSWAYVKGWPWTP
jgi:hypothetical protein